MSLGNLDGTKEGDHNLKDRKDKVLALPTCMHHYTMRASLASNSPASQKYRNPAKERNWVVED